MQTEVVYEGVRLLFPFVLTLGIIVLCIIYILANLSGKRMEFKREVDTDIVFDNHSVNHKRSRVERLFDWLIG